MGGMFSLVITALGFLGVILMAVFMLAIVLFVSATVVSIVFACRAKKRREQGKRLGGLIAVPIVLYAVSVPVLVFMLIAFVIPIAQDSQGVDYADCSQAVVRHEPEHLAELIKQAEPSFDGEGGETCTQLLLTAIDYDDEACAHIILDHAAAAGHPIDASDPVVLYRYDGSIRGEMSPLEYAQDKGASGEMMAVLEEASCE